MKIEAYIIGWCVEDTIAFTIKHYKQFCDKVTLFDNHSTDKTREIAFSLGADVRLFGTPGELNDRDYLEIKNNCWKGSQADWVIIVDDDEILYGDIPASEPASIFRTQGFEVFSHEMPKESFLELQEGELNDNYSKLCIFNPKRVKEINYVYGCHEARPEGDVIYSTSKLFLLHYRSIGGPKRLVDRHNSYVPRMSELNKRWGLGAHYYSKTPAEKIDEWKQSYERRVPLSSVLK